MANGFSPDRGGWVGGEEVYVEVDAINAEFEHVNGRPPNPDEEAFAYDTHEEMAADPRVVAYALEKLRAVERRSLEAMADEERHRYLSVGSAKKSVYEEKRRQADLIRANPGLDVNDDRWGWAYDRAARLHGTPVDEAKLNLVADEWLARYEAWRAEGRIIERVYEETLDALEAATTVGEIEAVMAGVEWAPSG